MRTFTPRSRNVVTTTVTENEDNEALVCDQHQLRHYHHHDDGLIGDVTAPTPRRRLHFANDDVTRQPNDVIQIDIRDVTVGKPDVVVLSPPPAVAAETAVDYFTAQSRGQKRSVT